MEAVLNLKGVGGRYNSFQNSPELLPFVDHSMVKSTEAVIEPEIMAYSFQTETTIADCHYKSGQKYLDAKKLVGLLMQNVSRNGTMLLNLTQHGRGDLDPEVIRICKDIGAWLKVNGEGVYASRPFEVAGDNSLYYTRNEGKVYATLLDWTGGPVTLKALRAGGATLGKVSKVELVGSDVALTFVQGDQGLLVTPSGSAQPLPGITNQSLATAIRVLRITHDKGWINDDDPGVVAPGWMRRSNLGASDYNNDLTISETPGDVRSSSFSGSSVSVIAPKEAGAGKIEVQIDGRPRATADESASGPHLAQQPVFEVTGLTPGQHSIKSSIAAPGQWPWMPWSSNEARTLYNKLELSLQCCAKSLAFLFAASVAITASTQRRNDLRPRCRDRSPLCDRRWRRPGFAGAGSIDPTRGLRPSESLRVYFTERRPPLDEGVSLYG
jgi:alpha-L-fucosidase